MVRGVILGLVALLGVATAPALAQSNTPFETEFGVSQPPMGYVAFCARGEAECNVKSAHPERLRLSPQIWDLVSNINFQVNTRIKPMGDQEQYGVADYWTYPTNAGDCEDYALEKKRELVTLGLSPSDLLMTVVLDEHGEGHAILTVATDKGDYMLDNRRDEILRWDQTHYKFLKRQSQQDPKQWVSLKSKTEQVLVSSRSLK